MGWDQVLLYWFRWRATRYSSRSDPGTCRAHLRLCGRVRTSSWLWLPLVIWTKRNTSDINIKSSAHSRVDGGGRRTNRNSLQEMQSRIQTFDQFVYSLAVCPSLWPDHITLCVYRPHSLRGECKDPRRDEEDEELLQMSSRVKCSINQNQTLGHITLNEWVTEGDSTTQGRSFVPSIYIIRPRSIKNHSFDWFCGERTYGKGAQSSTNLPKSPWKMMFPLIWLQLMDLP